MATATVLKNRKIAISQGFELITVNCKSSALTTSEPQIATPVDYLFILSGMTVQYILCIENLLHNLIGHVRA